MLVEGIFLTIINHPFDQEGPAPADHSQEPMIESQSFHRIPRNPTVNGHEIDTLLCLGFDNLKEILGSHLGQSLPLSDRFDSGLINGNGSQRDRSMLQNLCPDGRDIAPCAKVHHRIGSSLDRNL